MKTIQELYNEIMASEELKGQFIEAAKAGKQEEFLKAHGCEATLQEVQAFLEANQKEDAPLSFDELENAAGGGTSCRERSEIFMSIGTAGIGCAMFAAGSALAPGSHVGRKGNDNENDSYFCNPD